MSDPAILDAVRMQSPALLVLVPLLCAVFVVLQGRIIERRRTQLPRPATLKIPKKPPDSSKIVTGDRDTRTTDTSRPSRRIAEEDTRASVYQEETVSEDRHDRGAVEVESVSVSVRRQAESSPVPNASELFTHQSASNEAGEPIGSMTAPKGYQENVEPANYFTLRSVVANKYVQLALGVILAFCCIVLLPKKLAIAILIGMILLMVFKVI